MLYVAQQTFGFEQMIQHCLWKVLSETGLLHVDQLTEMESKVLADLFTKQITPSVNSQSDMVVLNRAIDKIVCHVKSLQLQGYRYNQVIAENHSLKSGLRNLIKIPEHPGDNRFPPEIDRPIDGVGLSKRTVRLLKSSGIETLQQLRACQLSRLRSQARVGVKTIHEIEAMLSTYSVHASAER